MTMSVRITNESPGTSYVARVKVVDTHTGEPTLADSYDLAVGQSQQVWLTSTRGVVVEEVQPDEAVAPAPDAGSDAGADAAVNSDSNVEGE